MFPIPALLAATARRQPEVASWIADLPGLVAGLAERWSLQVEEPFQPGGFCSWTAPVSRLAPESRSAPVSPVAAPAADDELVLKIGFPFASGEQRDEAAALRIWDGDGSVRLHAVLRLATADVLLIERCVPGARLVDMLPEPARDVVVAGLLKRLWARTSCAEAARGGSARAVAACAEAARGGGGWPFRPLTEMCDAWAEQFWRDYAAADQATRLDPGLAQDGIALFRELPRTASRDVLLCTDLHSENILASRREPWLVIDPKPYVGDPAYDVLQHMLNCEDRLAADPGGLCDRMADLADVDPDRVRLWLFARAVQESALEPAGWPLMRGVAKWLVPSS